MQIAIVGVTGVVGKELLQLLIEEKIPPENIWCVSRFPGQKFFQSNLQFETKPIEFSKIDLAFFCTASSVSKSLIPKVNKPVIIDLSSAFRNEKNIPLIIPEVNGHLLQPTERLIASPNCIVNIIGPVLHLLHSAFQLKRVIGSTYQAVSGGGKRLMQRLEKEMQNEKASDIPYAKNVLCHESAIGEDQMNGEERKIQMELGKVLNLPSNLFFFSCFRVPTVRSHGISLNLTFETPPDLELIKNRLGKEFSVIEKPPFANPYQASNRKEIFISRIRYDYSTENSLSLWVVGDQLLKGAALNALQIAKKYYQEDVCLLH